MSRRLRRLAGALCGLMVGVASCVAHAEDIDIFLRLSTDGERPAERAACLGQLGQLGRKHPGAELLLLDDGVPTTDGPKATSPNKEQGTKFAIEKCALYNVIYALQPVLVSDPPRFNVGLMLFNESGAPQGGYPRQQFLPLTRANAALLKATIKDITIGGDKANNGPYSQALYEAYLMFSQKAPYQGTAGRSGIRRGLRRPLRRRAGFRLRHEPHHLRQQRLAQREQHRRRKGPRCRGRRHDAGHLSTGQHHQQRPEQLGRRVRALPARHGREHDGRHAVGDHARGGGRRRVERRAVSELHQGHGDPRRRAVPAQRRDISSLRQFLLAVFNSIEAANSVFASASLPVSVNAQGTYQNQVFVGMFRPDGSRRPRWIGNLKQYQIATIRITETLALTTASAIRRSTRRPASSTRRRRATGPKTARSGQTTRRGRQRARATHRTARSSRRAASRSGCGRRTLRARTRGASSPASAVPPARRLAPTPRPASTRRMR